MICLNRLACSEMRLSLFKNSEVWLNERIEKPNVTYVKQEWL